MRADNCRNRGLEFRVRIIRNCAVAAAAASKHLIGQIRLWMDGVPQGLRRPPARLVLIRADRPRSTLDNHACRNGN